MTARDEVPQWSKRLATGLALISGIAFLILCATALDAGFWRRDVTMYTSFDLTWEKVRTEGRWLIAPLFPIISNLPGHLMWIIAAVSLWTGLFRLVDRLLGWPTLSAATTFVALSLPPFFFQLQWPDVICVASLIFAIGTFVLRPTRWKWLPLFGVLLFATLPVLYYLLALSMLPSRIEDRSSFLKSVLLGIWWGLGLILGYLVSATFNLVAFGHFGIEFAPWRQPTPARDLEGLLANLSGYTETVSDFWQGIVFQPAFFLFIVSLTLVVGTRFWHRTPEVFVRLSYVLVIAAAPVITILPSGIVLSMRTLLAQCSAAVLGKVLLLDRKYQPVGLLVILLFVGAPGALVSLKSNLWYAAITDHVLADAKEGTFGRPKDPKFVAVDMRGAENYFAPILQNATVRYGRPFQVEMLTAERSIASAFYAQGFGRIFPCTDGTGQPCEIVGFVSQAQRMQRCDANVPACRLGTLPRQGVLAVAFPGSDTVRQGAAFGNE